MADPFALQEEIFRALNQILIPWLQTPGDKNIVLAEPPVLATEKSPVAFKPSAPLKESGKGQGYQRNRAWPKEAVVSSGMPNLLFVIEGEADFRMLTTTGMLARQSGLAAHSGQYTIAMPAVTCLLAPPGVPLSDNTRPHWERPGVENAHSVVFWLHAYPYGGSCHLCRTRGKSHRSSGCLFVTDPQLMHLVELIFSEMRMRSKNYQQTVQGLLLAVLLRFERGLAERTDAAQEVPTLARELAGGHTASPVPEAALERARRFIDNHMGLAITPAMVASNAYISTAQLNRIFRSEMSMTVMQYVKQRRLESACFMLENTEMPIKQIAQQVGYQHPSHFTYDIVQKTGLSPREYRKNKRLHPTRSSRARK